MAENSPVAIENSDKEPEEYTVEEIRAKRKNPKTGSIEYLIKWSEYPESDNTWEPIENLKCPEIVAQFQEQEKIKRRRKLKTKDANSGSAKRLRKENKIKPHGDQPAIEEVTDNSDTETLSSCDGLLAKESDIRLHSKGFKRGLPIESIVGTCTDDDDKVWFFVKWQELSELDLVEIDELEENAPMELCKWYKERLYYTIKTASENKQHQLAAGS